MLVRATWAVLGTLMAAMAGFFLVGGFFWDDFAGWVLAIAAVVTALTLGLALLAIASLYRYLRNPRQFKRHYAILGAPRQELSVGELNVEGPAMVLISFCQVGVSVVWKNLAEADRWMFKEKLARFTSTEKEYSIRCPGRWS